jgi:ppGpp synthetase/RelA/SpoT-type nucleotidyltranferase
LSINQKVYEATRWYEQRRIFYEVLASKVEVIVKELLKLGHIDHHSVSSRAKTIQSYRKKASKEEYKDPQSEIMDMAGIRVITYTDSDAKKVAGIIREAFEIYPEHSIDKTAELGTDKVGYRGIHFVANLGERRLQLPENTVFKDYIFEIQVRSILQHAWAEFEHDRNYKFSGVLPKEIKRRLSLAAANLESVDRDFDDMARDIDAYVIEVEKRTVRGELAISIDSTSLRTYLSGKFSLLVKHGLVESDFAGDDDVIVEELRVMGIHTLADLDNIIPADFAERIGPCYETLARVRGDPTNFLGTVREILIIHDADSFFGKAWQRRWKGVDRELAILYQSYGVDINKCVKEFDLDLY